MKHLRTYPFRPPRRVYDDTVGNFALYFRFLRAYVQPFKWAVGLIMLLVCMECCSVFLLAYFTRVVVDKILVVSSPRIEQVKADRRRQEGRTAGMETLPVGRQPPAMGLGHRINLGLQATPRPPGAGRWLLYIALAYIGTIVTLNLLMRLAARTRIRIGQRITANLRDDMHKKVIMLSLAYHSSHTPGRLLSRILWDVNAVQDQMLTTIINTVAHSVMIVIGFALLFSIDWRLAALSLTVMPFYVLIFKVIRPYLKEAGFEMSHTNSCLYGLVAQKFDSIRAVQAYGRERQERLNFHRLSAVFLRDALRYGWLSALISRSGEVLSGLGTNGAVFLTGVWFVLEGRITLGEMLYAFTTASSLFAPVLQLSNINIVMTNLLISLRRLSDILDEPIEIKDRPDAVDFPSPVRQGIVLNNVHFQYPGATEPVFHNVNLTIPAGTWLCIMGPSGSGKTTLLHMLARLYEPTTGEILIDGIPLKKIKIDPLRQRLALVPQEARIFSGTLRDNICYGYPDATPQQIMDAAKAAEFHDFIMTMKVQYETLLGEKGTTLSGGQKQRLSLARALITNPDVLLLDDVTSALDAETERKIQETLSRILQGKTAVIVSQRVSMARRCHRICVVSDGLVAEFGTHEELLLRKGFYSRLHAQQTE